MNENEMLGFAKSEEKKKVSTEKEAALEKEEKKVEVKPYQVFGQDFSVSDPEIIDYYKTRMKMMTIKFKLVGRVDENAQYKVPDAIRYDLIKMEKEIEENGEDYYKAISLYMKKHFFFHIKIVPVEDGKAKASLYLSEYVEDFLGMEYIVSHVADFIDTNDDEYRIRLRKAFNLVDVATKVDDFAVPELAVLMQDNFDLELIIGGLYDMASQIFIMRMLKALEESGEAGAKVLAKYRQLLAASQGIEINEKFRNSHYKALLDRAIDELGGYEKLGLDPQVMNSIMKDMNGTVKAIDNASGKRGVLEMNLPKTEDKKKVAGKSVKSPSNKKSDSSKPPAKKPPTKKTPPKADAKPIKKGGGVSEDTVRKIFAKIELPKQENNGPSRRSGEVPPRREPENTPPPPRKEPPRTETPPPQKPEQQKPELEDDDEFGAMDEVNAGSNAVAERVEARIDEVTHSVTERTTTLPDGTRVTVREEEFDITMNIPTGGASHEDDRDLEMPEL